MNYKNIAFNTGSLHIIKTERFKSFIVDVVFKLPVTKEELPKYNFLSWLLNESSKKYPTKRRLFIKLEELYSAYFNVNCGRVGNNVIISASIESIKPDLLEDKKHFNDILNFLKEVILNPNVKKHAFDEKTFNIVKNYISIDIDSIKEDPSRIAHERALKMMDENSISATSHLGTREIIDQITKEELYDLYYNMLNHSYVDIFIIGNLDEKILKNNDNISELFDLLNNPKRSIIIKPNNDFVDNKINNKVSIKREKGSCLQSQLVMIFNTIDLTKTEKDIALPLFNYLFGSGGLKSKLYSSIREKHGYCYHIGSSYYKYDNLLCVTSSLKEENTNHTIKLVNASLKEMCEGDFTDEDLQDAKKSMALSLNYQKNNINSLLNTIENQIINNAMSMEERIKCLENITKKDIINVAKKIKSNTNYLLVEE